MCGIVGYIGSRHTIQTLVDELKRLEYRGYDSAGVAVLENDKITTLKESGKVQNLQDLINVEYPDSTESKARIGIAHTRWATHGKPTEANAHPHGLTHSRVVHNGIIENYQNLRLSVQTPFLSQTDSEVIVHLFEKKVTELGDEASNLLSAFRSTLDDLCGAYAMLLISDLAPGQIFFARKGSPLQVGFSDSSCYFASSDVPLIGYCKNTMYLEDVQWGVASQSEFELFDEAGDTVPPKYSSLPVSSAAAHKEGFRYFMEKEII